MLFSWLKRRSRRAIRRAGPSPKWQSLVVENLWQHAFLTSEEQQKLRDAATILVAEKNWEGCAGLEVNEDMKLTVAAQLALMTLGFRDEYFDRVQSILIYPDAYRAKSTMSPGGGMIIESQSARLGEAWYRGPVILSWPDILAGGREPNRGHNLVVHEFAHQLDMLNGGSTDGVPPMGSDEQAVRWLAVVEESFHRLIQDCEHGGKPIVDCYGATNRTEFFAVASEAYFQTPARLHRDDRQLFDVLREYYGQDAMRWAKPS